MLDAKRFFPALAFLLCLAFSLQAGYAPGTGAVAKWDSAPDYGQFRKSSRPICLYFYFSLFQNVKAQPPNPAAQYLEGSDFLGNSEVRKKLESFRCVKYNLNATADPTKTPRAGPVISSRRAMPCIVVCCSLIPTSRAPRYYSLITPRPPLKILCWLATLSSCRMRLKRKRR